MNDLGLHTLLHRCEHVYTDKELAHKLERAARDKRQLRVKLGMDPTAPDIHLGHCVVLRKMRQFQDLGHKAVLIIGDFTARIGDPTGRSKTRPVLSEEEIRRNADTYLQQAGRVLDMSPDRLEVRWNSEWLAPMKFDDVLRLAGRMTVGQMLKREDFRKRYENETPISIHELLYPLVQGWDSVNIKADVELGGTDQTYNNLVGRELQAGAGQEPQIVMVMPILRGADGVKKMSKSLGNYIGVSEPPGQIYGKTMSIPDDLMPEWFTLATTLPESRWKAAIADHPKKAKDLLARSIGEAFYSRDEMTAAAAWWESHFGKSRVSEAVVVMVPAEEMVEGAVAVWKLAWLAHDRELSRGEAKRMVEGGAFEFDGRKITDPNALVTPAAGVQFRAGRHRKGERVKQPLIAVISSEPQA
ncbi:Tyrosine--tRNA ligase [Phycisphaerae bacterium RAS1]|nr:Tyrosine--tRNA ligase [Phycisphaerae bacterium RAS1]